MVNLNESTYRYSGFKVYFEHTEYTVTYPVQSLGEVKGHCANWARLYLDTAGDVQGESREGAGSLKNVVLSARDLTHEDFHV